MGLFAQPLEAVRRIMDHRGRRLDAGDASDWLTDPQVVLRQDTALELGGPRAPSCFAMLWDDMEGVVPNRVTLVGQALEDLDAGPLPVALVVMASGPPVADDALYDHLCALRDAVYGAHLRGVQARLLPSRQSVWLRVSEDALADGLDAEVLGDALIQSVSMVPGVEAAEVLLVTGGETVEALVEPAQLAASVVEALGAMDQGMEMECDGCPYQAMCDLVDELRLAHAQKAQP